MSGQTSTRLTSSALRRELAARNASRGQRFEHELSFGAVSSVVYTPDQAGGHGNFLPAAYRRIVANPDWAARLEKSYTGSARLPRSRDRWRGELECATSSDALLMNVFCYPGVLSRRGVCAALGIAPGLRPAFGVRAQLAMQREEVDRTEFDMALGDLWIEAKLTEGGFGRASRDRLLRYFAVQEIFHVDSLPWRGNHVVGYQLIRGILAAARDQRRYLVLLDRRRADLEELCFQVLRSVHNTDARCRLHLLSWQELAASLPPKLQAFLVEKFGIEAQSLTQR